MRITLAIMALCFFSFVFYPQPAAQAATYDAQCKAQGGSLTWDGVGLRWCCIKRIGLSTSRVHKSTLWCKS